MTSFAATPSAMPLIRPKTMGLIAGVLALHVGMGWLLMQMNPIVLPPPKPKPIQIKMVELLPPPPAPSAPPKQPEPPQPVAPPKQVQLVERPKPEPIKPKPVPIIATKPLPTAEPPPVAPVMMAAPAPIDVDPPPAIVAAPAPTPSPAPVEKAPSAPKMVAVTGVSYQRAPDAEYPESARDRGEQGVAVIKTLIGVNGKVESATIEKSSGSRQLDQAALRAVKRASFYPYQENGVAAAVYTLIPIEFTLED